MGPNASKLMATGMATAMLAAVPAVATAKLDYSKNSVSGEFTPVTPSPVPVPSAKSPAGFSWGAAGAGAGAMLLVAFALAGARQRRRRGSVPASPLMG